jgi:hypothetical protein
MTTEKLENVDLQAEDTWDFDSAETRPGKKSSRIVVSVAFPRQEFEEVTNAAKQLGVPTSQFIREAALERVANRSPHGTVSTFSPTSAGFIGFTIEPVSWTEAAPAQVEEDPVLS